MPTEPVPVEYAPARPETVTLPVRTVRGATVLTRPVVLAVEEPLEIRVVHGPRHDRVQVPVSVTMRTPGHDTELAAGFLFAEGVVADPDDIEGIVPCGPADGPAGTRNVVRVELRPCADFDPKRLDRHFYTTSSCGVCGKTSLDALEPRCPVRPAAAFPVVPAAVIHALPDRLRAAQPTFDQTGGLHAAALFDPTGELLSVREDVGRHNAVDKLVGAELLADRLPLADRVLFVSGRASFELMQKALAAGIPILAAVGAPSSLAVDLAGRFGLTLLGFVRDGRFNVYSGADRVGGL